MGSCSSVHRNSNGDMKTEKLVIPPSPIKQKSKNGNFIWSPSRSTTNFTDHGSKEEAFFDSKAWLDSDCEDDFYSVKGDFTPSRGSTPIHHTFGDRTPGSIFEPSPEKKKKLLELFRESVKDDQEDDNGHKELKPTTIQDVLPRSSHCTPYLSGTNSACSSERTMSEDRVSIREKSARSLQSCIPSLLSCRSFSERRRKASPVIAINGKH